MTRIFIFNNASRAAVYGIGTYARQLVQAIGGMSGHEVSLVDIWADTRVFETERDSTGMLHYRIPPSPSGREDEAYLRSVFFLLARHMDIDRNDNAVFHFNYYQHLPLAWLLKGHVPECRIILTVHYFSWCFELKGNLTEFRRIMDDHTRMASRWGVASNDDQTELIGRQFAQESEFLHLADDVIALSRWTVEILKNDYGVLPSKVHLIYNGCGDSLKSSLRGHEDPDRRDVLFVGRLDGIKGLDHLIYAFTKVADRHPDSNLLIAGDGDFAPYMEKARAIHRRVSFLGKLEQSELEMLYASACIGVMPSFHEQCSYTAIEMMRHGIPFIGTDSTGLGEMLEAAPELRVHIDEEGFDEDSFTHGIASRLDLLLSDTELRDSLAERFRRRYTERHTAGMMAERHMDVVSHTFRRPGCLSQDCLPHLDDRMTDLINRRPDIDICFFGMGGIGVYLWWRTCQLKGNGTERIRLASLLEYLIYYIDWLEESAEGGTLPPEVTAMLSDMELQGFYRPAVRRLLSYRTRGAEPPHMPDYPTIIINALKICNCKI